MGQWYNPPEAGTGTVTSFSFTDANGFTGIVATPTTTPNLTLSISDAAVTAKLLTGYVVGPNSDILATDTILSAFGKVQGQLDALEVGDNITLNVIPKGTGTGIIDGSWLFSGNDLYPNVDGSNIGLAGTNRIGTIFMSSTIDYVTSMNFSVGGVNKFVFNSSGNVTTGTWNASVIGASFGGTGVANSAASTITISGAFATTFTITGVTNVTLPTSGTLLTSANAFVQGGNSFAAPARLGTNDGFALEFEVSNVKVGSFDLSSNFNIDGGNIVLADTFGLKNGIVNLISYDATSIPAITIGDPTSGVSILGLTHSIVMGSVGGDITYNADTQAFRNSSGASTFLTLTSAGATTGLTTFALLNTTATTVNAFGAATTMTLGTVTATATYNFATGATAALSTKTINIGTAGLSGSISTINIGSSVSGAIGTITFGNQTLVSSDTSLTLFNTTSTTVNAFGAATALNLGASTGTTTIANATVTLSNATTLNINGASPTIASTSTGALTLFNTNITTVNAFGAITTLAIGNVATAAQTVNMFTASTGASTYNFASGATAAATTKIINIGTNGVSGSTTNITIGSAVSGALGTIFMGQNVAGRRLSLGDTNTPVAANLINITQTYTTGAVAGISGTLTLNSTSGTDSIAGYNLSTVVTGTSTAAPTIIGVSNLTAISTINTVDYAANAFRGHSIRLRTLGTNVYTLADGIYLQLVTGGWGTTKPAIIYGLDIQNLGISGTTTSSTINIQAQSGSTNNYAITSALGNLHGFGTIAPTAYLHLGAGVATANIGAPLKYTSGTNLTVAESGAIEFDGTAFYKTVDTTNGRSQDSNQQIFRLTANGSAIGAAIANYFGANSAIPTVTNGVYEIVFYLYYLKTTAGTVTYTLTNTQTYTNCVASWEQSAVGGIAATGTMATSGTVTGTAAALVIGGATGSLTTAVNHKAVIRCIAECGTAGDIRLRVTESAGTITPLRGSYYTVRRLFAGNVGTFAA